MDAPRKNIGGREYAFGQLPATKALKIELVIGPRLFEAMAIFAKSQPVDGQDDADGNGTSMAVIRAVSALMNGLSAEDYVSPDGRRVLGIETVMRMVFDYVTCDGKPVDLDVTFTGRNADKYLVLGEALRLTFADFFSLAGPLVSARNKAAKQ